MPQAAPLPNILERSESKKSESDNPTDSKSSDLALLCSHNEVSMLYGIYYLEHSPGNLYLFYYV